MTYSKIFLSTSDGIRLALSNTFPNTFDVSDAVEDSKDSKDLENRLSKIKSYTKSIKLERETSEYVRYKLVSVMCDNVEYLKIVK